MFLSRPDEATETGSAAWLTDELARCRLGERNDLRAVADEFLRTHPQADSSALGEHLILRGIIKPYQLDRVLAGRGDGLVLDRYVILDATGTHDLGLTFCASGHNDRRLFDLKLLPEGGRWNFRHVRQKAAGFVDAAPPSIVPLADAGTVGRVSFLAWQHLDAETLADRVRRLGPGPLPVSRTLLMAIDLAEAMQFLHRQQVWHGCISPQSVRIGTDGHARLTDLGLGALLAESDLEPAGLPWPDCAPPETLIHPAHRSIRADQYALGCTLYFALAGEYPFAGRTAAEVSEAHRREGIPDIHLLNPAVPPAFANVIRRLTQRDPLARYDTPDDLMAALAPLSHELGLTASGQIPRVSVSTRTQMMVPRVRMAPLLADLRDGIADEHKSAHFDPIPVVAEAPPLVIARAEKRSLAGRWMDGLRFWRGPTVSVEIALLGPDRVLPGEIAIFQVVAMPRHEIDQARRLPDWRGSVVVPQRLARGAKLSLHLGFIDAQASDGWRESTWHGTTATQSYRVRVPSDWQPGQALAGQLTIAADGVPAGQVPFRVPVLGARRMMAVRG